jgi:hypothetical protein
VNEHGLGTGRGRGKGQRRRALDVDPPEFGETPRPGRGGAVENGHTVLQVVTVGSRLAEITVHHLDPAREQPSALGAAHERSHAPAVGKKPPRGVAPDESGPTGEKDGLHPHHDTEVDPLRKSCCPGQAPGCKLDADPAMCDIA